MADREKGGGDGNTKVWITQERKELFRWTIIWWKNEKQPTLALNKTWPTLWNLSLNFIYLLRFTLFLLRFNYLCIPDNCFLIQSMQLCF